MRSSLFIAAVGLLVSAPALATDVDTFDFSGSSWDKQGSLQLVHPKLGQAGSFYAGLGLVYADDPLVRRYEDGTEESIVKSQFSTRIGAGYNIGGKVRVDVGVPLYPSVNVQETQSFAMGDLSLGVLIPVGDSQDGSFGFGLQPYLTIPTGSVDAFTGRGGVGGGAIAALGGNVEEFGWRANVGIDLGQSAVDTLTDLEFGTSFDAGLGAHYNIQENLLLGAELTSDVELSGEVAWNKNPVEGHLYGSWMAPSGLMLTLGAGTGIIAGVGAPDYRVLGALTYRFDGGPGDADKDGITDDIDRCVNDPEDMDGFQDDDGCPDVDNDKDAILDVNDSCPNEAEDKDGFKDDDGCPDPDNDNDGIADGGDDCPNDPGPAATNGCPDRDGDGLADTEDECPDEPGPRNTKGCPDRDGDRVPDKRDKCPDEPISPRADPARSDGCPSRVIVTKDSIDLEETVYFNTGKATIKPVSFGLLDDVAKVMIDNPSITLIRVEGHTDSQGKDSYNLTLSQQRAESVVNYLVKKGVDRSRMEAKGYGEANPIDTNDTADGRANNRRVEIAIIKKE